MKNRLMSKKASFFYYIKKNTSLKVRMDPLTNFLNSQKAKITRYINKGGFKQVFEIEINGTKEALKVTNLFDETVIDPEKQEELKNELLARSTREVNLIKMLGGQNIVSMGSIDAKVIDADEKPIFLYTEEFIPGKTLDVAIRDNGPSLPDFDKVKTLFKTGLNILQKFEQSKIIHRDIKPQNIMMTDNPTRPFVFFDLGIAFDQQGTSLTARTLAPGTLRYRAPETLDPNYKSYIDIRSDLFSFAVTAFEFATGIHPIHPSNATPGETFYRLLKVNAEPLASKRTDFPKEFCNLIDRCLKKKPALRPRLSDAIQIMEQL